MPLNRRPNPRMLGQNRSGMAALEFSFVAPMLFLMVSSSFDVGKLLILKHQVEDTAHLVAISATTASVSGNQTTSISQAAARQAMSIVFAEMPWVRIGLEQGTRSVTLTSLLFKPIASCPVTAANNCYNAEVAFSVSYSGGAQTGTVGTPFTPALRACGNLTQIGPKDTIPNGKTWLQVLRTAQVAKPDALLIADVAYTYTPAFLKVLTGPIILTATSMSPARSGSAALQGSSQGVQYTTYTGSDGTGNCPNL